MCLSQLSATGSMKFGVTEKPAPATALKARRRTYVEDVEGETIGATGVLTEIRKEITIHVPIV